ncbi:MAG: beta-agarase, partial [Terriglobia bacterium]
DVYSARFEATAQRIAHRECAPRAYDPNLVGYFSDNELRWGPDWRGKQNMLAMYLGLPSTSPGRQRAINFLRKKYSGRIELLNRAWDVHATRFADVPSEAATNAYRADNLEFLGKVAQRYFQVCARAIHAADPNHLYLGAKFAGLPPDPVLRASHLADVVSVDIYAFDPRPAVKHIFQLARRPVLVAEFAFRAEDSGLPNTQGAGPKVPDQAARARAYTNFVTRLESLPEAVGYHWFEWCDEPRQGRFDGENSNYGLVRINDRPYASFVRAVNAANRQAISVHRALMK